MTNAPISYFAIGTTQGNMVNVETLLPDAPHVPNGGRVPYVGSMDNRAVDGALVRDGYLNGKWLLDFISSDSLFSWIYGRYGSYTTSTKRFYVSTLDESNNFSPYYVYVERPSGADGTITVAQAGYWLVMNVVTLTDCQLQTLSKSASYTVTSSDHYISADATAGNIVLTLPDPATVNSYVIYSALLAATASSHTVSYLYSAVTYASTATAYNRISVYSDGAAWKAYTP